MPRSGPLRVEVEDTWRYALPGGLASIPATAASYWETGSDMSFSAVVLGGLLAGYLANRRAGTSQGVGLQAGLAGALPVFWVAFDILVAGTGLSGPAWFIASGAVLAVLVTAVFVVSCFVLSAVAGEIGGRIGNWLAAQSGRRGPPAVSS